MFAEKSICAAEGVTLSGKQTANGRHSGEAALSSGAEGATAHFAPKSLRQKDGKMQFMRVYRRYCVFVFVCGEVTPLFLFVFKIKTHLEVFRYDIF